jgi:two-component system, NtrC family, nitrogen regulation sensor histidine kinase NtrY
VSFRRKLLAVFALTVSLSVGSVAWIVLVLSRHAFERADAERTTALVAQFRREFQRRGQDVIRRVEAIATSESVTRMALALNRSAPDYSSYVGEARTLADNQHLDFLELIDAQGVIISSAQRPARFGYREESLNLSSMPGDPFLKSEELAEGAKLALSAVREVKVGDKSLYVIGGQRVDENFLATLELPTGMRAMFYQNLGPGVSPSLLIDASGVVRKAEPLSPLIKEVQEQSKETETNIHWSSDAVDDEIVNAIPLSGQNNQLLGILLVGNARRPYVELRRHIRYAALLAGSAGIVLAILFSGWAAARVIRPVEQLAEAAREVAAGNWSTQVAGTSADELGELAESFNHMTRELLQQREHLVQAERVAAWRELARRLAHELKNPLFPLQLTVENLIRAREHSPEQFEEVFRESSSTLLAEIANLKAIISRFSEFSKMPQPQFQRVQINEIVQNVFRLFQVPTDGKPIEFKLDLDDNVQEIAGDPDLLHRSLSNLVLNAMDAMPEGGTLTIRTGQKGDLACIEISDSGVGLTPEECQRLFTPYYTTKTHGTGLGLAIVQSVISDHGGRISVRSEPGRGTTFQIALPHNLGKLEGFQQAAHSTAPNERNITAQGASPG